MSSTITSLERHPVMGLLDNGIPLSLLIDLASPSGPASADILASEDAETLVAACSPPAATPARSHRAS